MTFATVALVSVGLAVALWAGPLYGLCERAAADLVAPGTSFDGGRASMKRRDRYALPLFVVLVVTWVLLQGGLDGRERRRRRGARGRARA